MRSVIEAASGFSPPTPQSSATPPYTSMPLNSRSSVHASGCVGYSWLFSTSPASPASRARATVAEKSALRSA